MRALVEKVDVLGWTKSEVLRSKVKYRSGVNGPNIMDIAIEEEYNECFNKCFDDEILYLRQKIKREASLEQTEKRKFAVGYYHGKLNVLTSSYQLPPMTCSQLIVNWFLGSVYDNLPYLWTFSSKEVKHIKNGMIMWNMMKCFMYEVKRVDIAKVCWKSKMKD